MPVVADVGCARCRGVYGTYLVGICVAAVSTDPLECDETEEVDEPGTVGDNKG